MAQGVDITKAAFTAVLWNDPNLSRGTDGLQTLRWRKTDSNLWSHVSNRFPGVPSGADRLTCGASGQSGRGGPE